MSLSHITSGDGKIWPCVLGGVAVGALGTFALTRLLPKPKKKRVFVSGCFDLLHTGHVAFFKEAAEHGDLFVSVGNDANIFQLKNHKCMFPEKERTYMVQSIRYVHEAFVAQGMGHDQMADLKYSKADIFFVNEDGKAREASTCWQFTAGPV
jgi:cytidyltransferase-like protein